MNTPEVVAEQPVVTETPETIIPASTAEQTPKAEAPQSEAAQLVDKARKTKKTAVKAEAPQAPPAVETPKPESPVETKPVTEAPAVTEPKPEAEGWNDEELDVQSMLKDITFEDESTPATSPEKPAAPSEKKDSYSIKEFASRFGIEAETIEDFEKQISSKFRSDWQSEQELTRPLRDIDELIKLDDKELVRQVRKYEGYTDEEAQAYLDSIENSNGVAGIQREALAIRVQARQQRAQIEQQVTKLRTDREQVERQQQEQYRSMIMSMEKVAGVPVNKALNETFANKVLSGELTKELSDPAVNVQAMRLWSERKEIFKSLVEQGAKAGFNKARAIYESKLFNKDAGSGGAKGVVPMPETKGDISSTIDAARRHIRTRLGVSANS